MADNTHQQDNALIATDVLTTLNGVAVSDGSEIQRMKPSFGSDGVARDVDASNPLPVDDADTQAALASILAKLSSDPATQTTVAAVLAKLSSDPATQTTLAAVLVALQGTLTVGLPSGAATSAAQATEATKLDTLHTDIVTLQGYVDGLETNTTGLATSAKQDTAATKLDTLHTDLGLVATQTTLAAVLAKLSSDPATQTTLAAVLVKLADPASQTTLAAVLAKLTSDPSTATLQGTANTKLDTVHTDLGHLTDGTQTTKGVPLASATLANVASSASSVTLQASNANRRSWSVFNDSTAVLYVKFGATASSSSFTVQVAAGGYYEMPLPVYTGTIDGIWASANGNARVTEGA